MAAYSIILGMALAMVLMLSGVATVLALAFVVCDLKVGQSLAEQTLVLTCAENSLREFLFS